MVLGRNGWRHTNIVIEMTSRANGRLERTTKSQTGSRADILSLLLLLPPSLLSLRRFPSALLRSALRGTCDGVARGEIRDGDTSGSLHALAEVVKRVLDVLDRSGRRGRKGDVEALEVANRGA